MTDKKKPSWETIEMSMRVIGKDNVRIVRQPGPGIALKWVSLIACVVFVTYGAQAQQTWAQSFGWFMLAVGFAVDAWSWRLHAHAYGIALVTALKSKESGASADARSLVDSVRIDKVN